MDLQRKILVMLGMNESGKTVLAKHLGKSYSTCVFDVLKEYDNKQFDVYVPKSKGYPEIAQEFDRFVSKAKSRFGTKWNMLIIDEASRIFPSMRPLLPEARGLLDTFRHYPITLVLICRRPVQLFTDFVELSHYIFTFVLKGKNDIQYFNNINSQVGDVIASLPNYHFVTIDANRNFTVHKPIPL